MNETLATLGDLAGKLESLGMVKEAERLDILSNTIEAAYLPQVVYPAGHPSQRIPDPDTGTPEPLDVVMRYRDRAQTHIESIKTGLQQFGALLGSIANEEPRLKKYADKYRAAVHEMESEIEARLKDFLLYLKTEHGGKEESVRHSIDYTRLAGKDRG